MNFNLLNPLSKNMHLVILSLYAYVLLCHVKETDYVTMVVLTAATCMAICYLRKPLTEGVGNCAKIEDFTVKEGLENSPQEGLENSPQEDTGSGIIRQLPAHMGPYDGLCLQTGNKEHWMKSPNETGLLPNDALFSYLSSQGPLKPVFSDNSALLGPPIDGVEGSPKKMFMFANNRTSPDCCPATFSTSTGCVCTTKNQRDYIADRGTNKGTRASLEDI